MANLFNKFWGSDRTLVVFLMIVTLGLSGWSWAKAEEVGRESAKQAISTTLAKENNTAACVRLNILRSSTNLTAEKDYKSAVAQYEYDKLFAKLVKESPTAPEPQRAKTISFLTRLEKTTAVLKDQIESQEWVPLTDCTKAENFPATYLPPLPVRFSVHFPSKGEIEYRRLHDNAHEVNNQPGSFGIDPPKP